MTDKLSTTKRAFWNRKTELALHIVTLIAFVIYSLQFKYTYDDYWTYGFSHYVAQGLKPYVDMNMIITPFAAYFYAIPLLIKDSTTVYTISGIVTNLFIYFLYVKISSNLGFKPFLRWLASTLCFIVFPCVYKPNYNILLGVFVLLTVWIFLKAIDAQKISFWKILALAVISVTAVMTKQSTGLCVVAATCLLGLILSIVYTKKDVLSTFLNCMTYATIVVIALTIFLLIFRLTGILDEFITFSTYASTFRLNDNSVKIAIAIFVINMFAVIYMAVYAYKKDKNLKYLVFAVCHGFLSIGIYPLSNLYHYQFTNFLAIFMIFIFMKDYGKEVVDNMTSKMPYKFVVLMLPVMCLAALWAPYNLKISAKDKETAYETNHVGYNIEEHAEAIGNYMSSHPENEYYVIHEIAMPCSILGYKDYLKYYDLLNEGNIGDKSAVDLIKDADCDYFIVTYNRDEVFWQLNDEMMNLIFDMELVDTIQCPENENVPAFAVYKNEFKEN